MDAHITTERWATKQADAIDAAVTAAHAASLAMTVIRNEQTCGWWYVNALSQQVARSEAFVTYLPSGYFN